MEETLKKKVLKGMVWSGIERLGTQLMQFVIGLVLARLLMPSDYGLVGMLAIFMALASTLVDSGFPSALTQRKNRTQEDYSTTFFLNIIISLSIYAILFVSAPWVAEFFNQPILCDIMRVYTLSIIINGIACVQFARFMIAVDFRNLTIVSFVSMIIAGAVGIYMAYTGFGVWALVFYGITNSSMRTILLWILGKWVPSMVFSKKSLKSLFGIGSKVLLSNVIIEFYTNFSTVIIGKFFPVKDLGYYTRANQFCTLPTQTVSHMIIYPSLRVMSDYQDNPEQLRQYYSHVLRNSAFFYFPIMFGLSALATPLISVLIKDQWLPAAPYIPILAAGCLWYPLAQLSLNLFTMMGKPGLTLKLQFIQKPLGIGLLLCSIPLGIMGVCAAIAVFNFLSFLQNCHYVKRLIDFGFARQMKCLLPVLGYCILMTAAIVGVNLFIGTMLMKLIIGFLTGVAVYIIAAYICRDHSLKDVGGMIVSKFRSKSV